MLAGPNTTVRRGNEVMYGRASFVNCNFWGGPSQIMLLRPDAGFVLSVSNSVFRNWDRSNYAIDARPAQTAVVFLAARTLNATRQPRVTLSLR